MYSKSFASSSRPRSVAHRQSCPQTGNKGCGASQGRRAREDFQKTSCSLGCPSTVVTVRRRPTRLSPPMKSTASDLNLGTQESVLVVSTIDKCCSASSAVAPDCPQDECHATRQGNYHNALSTFLRSLRSMGLLGRKKKEKKPHSHDPINAAPPTSAAAFVHDSPDNPSYSSDVAVAQVISALEVRGLQYVPTQAKAMLQGRFCGGDPARAINLALALRDAEDMILIEPSTTYMLGAENIRGTTCYLDALLFSMYSRSFPLFDSLLYHQGTSTSTTRLAVNLRLFVNLLRSGQLVTSDIVSMLRRSIGKCGWEDALSEQQQDTSECFGFIAEMLDMPLLTFRVHIAHGGKRDSNTDNKTIKERFLALAIPEPSKHQPPGASIEPIELVDLIDQNFHSKMEIRRPVARSRSTLVDVSLSVRSLAMPEMDEHGDHSISGPPGYRPGYYSNTRLKDKKKDSKQEVTMQAWQLFELVPFYTATDSSDRQLELAKQPPVVAICLKRYYFNHKGEALINPTPVIIPEYIDFTDYTENDAFDSRNAAKTGRRVRLVLESAVCHRGQNIGSGHYISISRGLGPGQWLLFDDLAINRVSQGTFQYLFSTEVPYLLFYQLEVLVPRSAVHRRQPSVPNFGHQPLRNPPPIPQAQQTVRESGQTQCNSSLAPGTLACPSATCDYSMPFPRHPPPPVPPKPN